MISPLKKQLYSFFLFTTCGFFVLAILSRLFSGKLDFLPFLFFVSAFTALFIVFRRAYNTIFANARAVRDSFEEKINLANADIAVKKTVFDVLPQKSVKIGFLLNISNQLTNLVDSDEVFDFLLVTMKKLFPNADDILIFDIKGKHDSLSLVRSKHPRGTTIKEKRGDILDTWIVRNNQSILVDDLSKDFRFDYNRVVASHERGIVSFISSPLAVGDQIFGVVRVESKTPTVFSHDDFRLFRSICDLAAVVLERSALFHEIKELAIMDPLTSLFLRDHFFSRLKDELSRSGKDGTGVGIIMIDIDNFKKINDTYGHIVGDTILKRVAKIFNHVIGGHGNVVCRFGGEEFIAFLVDCDSGSLRKKALEVCESIAVSTVTFRRKHINFTVSGGAVICPDDGRDALQLMDKVDHLLYQAKKQGKNRICFSK